MADVPPGQILHLGIKKDRWAMANFLSGWSGFWTVKDGKTLLTTTMGPSGKTSGKEVVVAKRTESGLEVADPKIPKTTMRFTYIAASAPDGFPYEDEPKAK